MEEASFYLASSDGPIGPFKCTSVERLTGRKGDDFLRVTIEPPIIGQPYGLGDKDIRDVVLASRYAGSSLHPINEWPTTIFVCRILNGAVRWTGRATAADLEPIYIAELYPTLDAATTAIGGSSTTFGTG